MSTASPFVVGHRAALVAVPFAAIVRPANRAAPVWVPGGKGNWIALLAVLAAASGCTLLRTTSKEPSQLPTPLLSDDSVVLEITTVVLPASLQSPDGIWTEVDEQQLPVAQRRRLLDAGIRCGVVGDQLPAPLRDLLDQQPGDAQLRGDDGSAIDVTADHRRRLQCRTGKRHHLLTSALQQEMSLLWVDPNGVKGETLFNAQPLLLLRTYPNGDGSVRLNITPEVHHGQPRNRWVGRDGMFLLEQGQDRKTFDDLKIEARLAPGQTLLLSDVPGASGLGANFFREPSARGAHRMFLIRLAQTQYDDLHGPRQHLKPLVTTAD